MQEIPYFRKPAAGATHCGQWLWKSATAAPEPPGGSEAPAGSGEGCPQRRRNALRTLQQRIEKGEDLIADQKSRFDELSATAKELAQFTS